MGFYPAVHDGQGLYCQVIHMHEVEHWVSVTNMDGNGCVRLFDSLGFPISHHLKRAIASMYIYI